MLDSSDSTYPSGSILPINLAQYAGGKLAVEKGEKHDQKAPEDVAYLEVGNNALKVTPTRRQGVTGMRHVAYQ